MEWNVLATSCIPRTTPAYDVGCCSFQTFQTLCDPLCIAAANSRQRSMDQMCREQKVKNWRKLTQNSVLRKCWLRIGRQHCCIKWIKKTTALTQSYVETVAICNDMLHKLRRHSTDDSLRHSGRLVGTFRLAEYTHYTVGRMCHATTPGYWCCISRPSSANRLRVAAAACWTDVASCQMSLQIIFFSQTSTVRAPHTVTSLTPSASSDLIGQSLTRTDWCTVGVGLLVYVTWPIPLHF